MAYARLLRAVAGSLFLLSLPLASAGAQFVQTFVSVTGSNANDCGAVSSPCRTLQAALTATIAGGKIFVLDSGDFQSLTIDKSISIVAVGVDATLFTGSTTKVVVAAGPNDVIYLEGLTLRRSLPGSGDNSGLRFDSGRRLHLHNCLIQGFGNAGLFVEAPGPSDILVSDSVIADNAYGIWARRVGSGGQINVQLNRVTIAGNETAGIHAARAPTRIWLSESTIVNNAIGLRAVNESRIFSFQNNVIANNGSGGTPTDTRNLR